MNEGHVSSLRLWACSKCLCSVNYYVSDRRVPAKTWMLNDCFVDASVSIRRLCFCRRWFVCLLSTLLKMLLTDFDRMGRKWEKEQLIKLLRWSAIQFPMKNYPPRTQVRRLLTQESADSSRRYFLAGFLVFRGMSRSRRRPLQRSTGPPTLYFESRFDMRLRFRLRQALHLSSSSSSSSSNSSGGKCTWQLL